MTDATSTAVATKIDTAHVVIDLQAYYSKKIHKGSAKALGRKIAAFRDRLKEKGIPTIWVVFEPNINDQQKMIVMPDYPGSNILIANEDDDQSAVLRFSRDEVHSKYKFGDILPAEDEIVFSKVYDNAFANKMLHKYLQEIGVKNLLFSGLYSSMCIPRSILGGLKHGYDCTSPPHDF